MLENFLNKMYKFYIFFETKGLKRKKIEDVHKQLSRVMRNCSCVYITISKGQSVVVNLGRLNVI